MFFASLNVRIYVLDFTQPLNQQREQCYCCVIVPLFRHFFATGELSSLTLRSRFRLKQFSTCRWARGRNEVTWHPGQEAKFGAPMFEPEVFRKHCVLYWRQYLWYCWDFSAPSTVIRRPIVNRRPGNCAPCSLRQCLGCTKLVCILQVYFSCVLTASKGKAAVKIGMQHGKLVTDSRFYKPQTWKRKTSFKPVASAVRECAVCLQRRLAT